MDLTSKKRWELFRILKALGNDRDIQKKSGKTYKQLTRQDMIGYLSLPSNQSNISNLPSLEPLTDEKKSRVKRNRSPRIYWTDHDNKLFLQSLGNQKGGMLSDRIRRMEDAFNAAADTKRTLRALEQKYYRLRSTERKKKRNRDMYQGNTDNIQRCHSESEDSDSDSDDDEIYVRHYKRSVLSDFIRLHDSNL